MNTHDAFHYTVHNAPGGLEALAVRLGMSAQILRNKANPNNNSNHVALRDVERVMELTGDYGTLHALAKSCGFVCIKIEDHVGPSDLALLEVVTSAMSANGGFGAAINKALDDGRIQQHEVEQVKDAAFEASRALHAVVARFQSLVRK